MQNKNGTIWVSVAFQICLAAGCIQKPEYRQITVREYLDRMKGGWIGQMAGVGWGAPTEFKWNGKMIPAENIPEWTPEMVNQFGQDDIYVEMTFLRTLELYGFDVDIRQAGIDFANSRYMLWHANLAGRDNLRSGIAPPWSGHPKYNSHADDIDYQIEADYAGLISPGLPQSAVDLGEIFGRLMNYGDGLYGGQFVAGMLSEAFFESDIEKIIRAGLACIPEKSVYAETVRDVLDWYHGHPDDWETVWQKIEAKYNDNPEYRKFSCTGSASDFNIDAKLNGAYIVVGLLFGQGDLDKTIMISMRCGQDSDCNPSNAAGVLGTILGASRLPEKYTSALDLESKFSFTQYNFVSLSEVCEKLARQAVLRYGGRIEANAEGEEVFMIPVHPPRPSALEFCSEPGPVPEDIKFTEAETARITIKIRSREVFINAWQVAGPYMKKDIEGLDLFDVAFAPEGEPGVQWMIYPTDKYGPGVVALDKVFGTEHCAAYLRTRIRCPEHKKAVIELGSDDGIKLWLNGQLVHANNVMRGYSDGEDKVSVELNEGWNDLMAKITQGIGGWQAGFVITDEQGEVMEDLEIKAE
jgi:hypothetical protein